jgi:RNA polymerase sigma-70 factor (ECF subfamily)
LLSLILSQHARRDARIVAGIYVPLPEQDTRNWDMPMLREAESLLRRASEFHHVGRFQFEAAIQSAHASRAFSGETPWTAIADFYDALVAITPAIGVAIGRAIAHAKVSGPECGWTLLNQLPMASLADHQPYWAARAHLLAELKRDEEACQAFHRAIELCQDASAKEYLMKCLRMSR